jgi:hypothetical protein
MDRCRTGALEGHGQFSQHPLTSQRLTGPGPHEWKSDEQANAKMMIGFGNAYITVHSLNPDVELPKEMLLTMDLILVGLMSLSQSARDKQQISIGYRQISKRRIAMLF